MRSIRSGERVFIGTGCGEPRGLVRALEALHPGPDDIELATSSRPVASNSTLMSARRHRNRVFVAGGRHDAAGVAMIDYVAIGLDEVPALLAQGRLPVDVAMVQVSVPDAHGYASLGISVDLAPAALRAAKRIIAEVNPAMPRTHGDSLIRLDRVDLLTETECPLREFTHPPGMEIAVNIAAYVAAIIEDGSTLQIGMGAVPDQVLGLLGDRRDLGIHTDLLTDGVIDLIHSGAVTGRRKDLFRERVVASYCLGTQRLYDLVDDNPLFCFLPIEQVCAPETLARTGRLVSLTQAHAIDLAGQVCVDHPGSIGAGPSTQVAFLRAAARSPGGKPIICLPTTDADGASRIKPTLEGDVVGIARADVHYVVTEFGIAYLFGRSVRERALALIGVAHPNHRAALLEAARSRGLAIRTRLVCIYWLQPYCLILDVEGIDGVIIGPSDLGFSYGLEPKLDRTEPEILAIYEKIIKECDKRKLYPGIHCSGAEGAVRAINMGFKLVTLSNEVGLMSTYAKMQVNATRKDSGGKA